MGKMKYLQMQLDFLRTHPTFWVNPQLGGYDLTDCPPQMHYALDSFGPVTENNFSCPSTRTDTENPVASKRKTLIINERAKPSTTMLETNPTIGLFTEDDDPLP